MRIESINAIKNNEQHKQQAIKNAGSAAGKGTSGILFEEYLNAHIQKATKPAPAQTENQIAGLLMSYLPMLRVSTKSDRESESNVS